MNVNEVIANRALEILNKEKGDYKYKELENKEAWGIIKVRK